MEYKIIIVDDLPLQHRRIEEMVGHLLKKRAAAQVKFLHYLDSISFLKELDNLDTASIALIYVDQRFSQGAAKTKVLAQGRDPQQEGGYVVRQLLKRDLRKKIFFFGRNIPGLDDSILELVPATAYERNIYFFTAARLVGLDILGHLPFKLSIVPSPRFPLQEKIQDKKQIARAVLDGRKSFWPGFKVEWNACPAWPDFAPAGRHYFDASSEPNFPDSVYRLLSVFSLLQLWRDPKNLLTQVKGDWFLIQQKLSELGGLDRSWQGWGWLGEVKDGSSFRTNHFSFWQREDLGIPDFLRDLICNFGSSGYGMMAEVSIESEH